MNKNFIPVNNGTGYTGELKPATLFIRVKPYSVKELCGLYGMSAFTMRASLRPLKELLGPRVGNFYNTRQVEIIFRELGIPYTINESG
jgi:hypothetical protein